MMKTNGSPQEMVRVDFAQGQIAGAWLPVVLLTARLDRQAAMSTEVVLTVATACKLHEELGKLIAGLAITGARHSRA